MQRQVVEAAYKIDLFLWINARDRILQHLTPNGAVHQVAALKLFGLPLQADVSPPTAT